MSARTRTNEEGSVLLLILGLVVLAGLFVTVVIDDDRSDAEDRPHGSARWTTIARATRPKDSKKFLV